MRRMETNFKQAKSINILFPYYVCMCVYKKGITKSFSSHFYISDSR